jgi:hypothetical protein
MKAAENTILARRLLWEIKGSGHQLVAAAKRAGAKALPVIILAAGVSAVPAAHASSLVTRVSGTKAFVVQADDSSSSPTGLQFVPVSPCRVADTRNPTGPFGGPELGAETTREFNIPQGPCAVPTSAVAYSLNVTVVPNGPLDYLTIWPSGQPQPVVSTLNSDGRIKANAAITPAGTNGGVSVYVSSATHVILDINGYFVSAGTASALAFYPVTPCRVVDTRNQDGPLGGPPLAGGSSRSFPMQSGSCGLPATAQAYSLNVTAIPNGPLDYLTLWPSGGPQPLVSTLNASTGAITANAAIVPVGSDGGVSVYVSDQSEVVLDINGYFAPPEPNGLELYTVTPCRVLDTRSSSGLFTGLLNVDVAGSACAPPSTAQAYVLNATVVPPSPLDFLTLWASGTDQPEVSTLNANDGAVTSNMAVVPATDGIISAFAFSPTQLILDISSYFALAPGSNSDYVLAVCNGQCTESDTTWTVGQYFPLDLVLTNPTAGPTPSATITFQGLPQGIGLRENTYTGPLITAGSNTVNGSLGEGFAFLIQNTGAVAGSYPITITSSGAGIATQSIMLTIVVPSN